MRQSARVSCVVACATIAGVSVANMCGEALAGGFGIEQSAYYQGMSFAGAAAGGPSLASMAWNPATAGFAGNGLTFELSYSVIVMTANETVLNPQSQPAGSTETDFGENALIGASFATWRLNDKTVLGLSLTLPVRVRNEGRGRELGRADLKA